MLKFSHNTRLRNWKISNKRQIPVRLYQEFQHLSIFGYGLLSWCAKLSEFMHLNLTRRASCRISTLIKMRGHSPAEALGVLGPAFLSFKAQLSCAKYTHRVLKLRCELLTNWRGHKKTFYRLDLHLQLNRHTGWPNLHWNLIASINFVYTNDI